MFCHNRILLIYSTNAKIGHYQVTIPPLRSTPEDFPHFWRKVWKSTAGEGTEAIWSAKLANFLTGHPLPGNFRDLQRLAVRIYAFSQYSRDRQSAIKQGIADFESFQAKGRPLGSSEGYFQEGATFKQMEGRFRRDLVRWAEQAYGSLDQAAEVLGRKKSTLYQDRRWEEE